MTAASREWIAKMRALLLEKPAELRLLAMDTTLHVYGPVSTAFLAEECPANRPEVQHCSDWLSLGEIHDSGGW